MSPDPRLRALIEKWRTAGEAELKEATDRNFPAAMAVAAMRLLDANELEALLLGGTPPQEKHMLDDDDFYAPRVAPSVPRVGPTGSTAEQQTGEAPAAERTERPSPQAKRLRERCQMNVFTVDEPWPNETKKIVRQLLAALEAAERYIAASIPTQEEIAWRDLIADGGLPERPREEQRRAAPEAPVSPRACAACNRGIPVVMVDDDGIYTHISKRPGIPSHAVDDAWWPCPRWQEVAALPVRPEPHPTEET